MDDSVSNLCTVIISAVATLVTIAAVFVALWQTKWPYKIKLQVKARIVESKFQVDADKFYKEKRLFIQIYNVGFTDSSILSWGLYADKHFQFDVQYYGDSVKNLKAKTMMRNSIPLDLFQDPVKYMLSKYSKKNKKLKVYFRDISGKTFYKKLDLTIKELIKMNRNDFRCSITEEEYVNYYFEYMDFEPLRDYLQENDFKNGK